MSYASLVGELERPDYIAYYFQNYAEFALNSPQYNFDKISKKARVSALEQQINNVKLKTEMLVSQNGEAGKALGELLDNRNWENAISNGFNSDMLDLDVAPGVAANKSFTYKSADEINALADQLAVDMSTFLQGLTSVMEKIRSYITSPKTLDQYRGAIIAKYAKDGIVDDEVSWKIISDFLSKDGLKDMKPNAINAPEESLENVLAQCMGVLVAFPNFRGASELDPKGLGLKSDAKTTLAGQVLKEVVSKVSGLMNKAKGDMGELALGAIAGTADAAALRSINEAVRVSVNYTGTGKSTGGNFLAAKSKFIEDLNQREAASNSKSTIRKSTNKKDVEVVMDVKDGNGNVTCTLSYGYNVKNYRIDTSSHVTTYTVHSNGSFLPLYNNVFGSDYQFLFSLGAGHTSKKNLGGPTRAELDKQWVQLVRTVAAGNMANVLVGGVTENTLFLSLNKRIFLISDVLQKILEFVEGGDEAKQKGDMTSDFGYGYRLIGLSRRKMLEASKWVEGPRKLSKQSLSYHRAGGKSDPNVVKALERSRAAYGSLTEMLNSAKIEISLRTLTSLIIG